MGLFYTENQEVHAESTVDGRSGATALVPGNPWAHRGKAVQITSGSDDTRAALVSFVNAVRTGNRDTVCGVGAGLENTATAMIANEAIESEMPAVFPQDCRLRVTKT
jgi:hypothetical protein